MTHWIYENGIGEERAALVHGGTIAQARILRQDTGIGAGAVVMARIVRKIGNGKRAVAKLDTGEDAIISALPQDLTEGQDTRVQIVRAAISEAGGKASSELGRSKYALGKAVNGDMPSAPSPTLRDQIAGEGVEIREAFAHGADLLENAGWTDLLHEAQSGHVAFPGGSLVIVPTAAMTIIDVDGESAPRALALEAAVAAAAAIYRLDIGGSSGIDFPLLPGKADRSDVGSAFDAAMEGPFERTAVNGFGFMQVIRKCMRPSLLQMVHADAELTALLQLLRRAERDRGTGPLTLQITAAMQRVCMRHPDWLETLEKRIGRPVTTAANATCAEAAACLSANP